jgi:hypothetical protein
MVSPCTCLGYGPLEFCSFSDSEWLAHALVWDMGPKMGPLDFVVSVISEWLAHALVWDMGH